MYLIREKCCLYRKHRVSHKKTQSCSVILQIFLIIYHHREYRKGIVLSLSFWEEKDKRSQGRTVKNNLLRWTYRNIGASKKNFIYFLIAVGENFEIRQ